MNSRTQRIDKETMLAGFERGCLCKGGLAGGLNGQFEDIPTSNIVNLRIAVSNFMVLTHPS